MDRESQCRLLKEKRVDQFEERAFTSRLGYLLSDEKCFLIENQFL